MHCYKPLFQWIEHICKEMCSKWNNLSYLLMPWYGVNSLRPGDTRRFHSSWFVGLFNIKMFILYKYTLNVSLSAILKSPDLNSIRPRLGLHTILSVCKDHLLIHVWRTTSLPLEVRNPLNDVSHTKIKSIFNISRGKYRPEMFIPIQDLKKWFKGC